MLEASESCHYLFFIIFKSSLLTRCVLASGRWEQRYFKVQRVWIVPLSRQNHLTPTLGRPEKEGS